MSVQDSRLAGEPLVSVLMSVRNGGELLAGAVRSILDQTYPNIEFLIVDDGSTDDTCATVRSLSDNRVSLIVQEQNQGIARSLNAAARVAGGELLARQDADDLSEPNRIEAQVKRFLESPGLCLLGTQATLIDDHGARLGETRLPCEAPLSSAPMENPLVHGSVMIRSAAFVAAGGYDPRYSFAEDYELWLRLGRIGSVENLPEPLYLYRVHDGQLTSRNHEVRLAQTALAMVFSGGGRSDEAAAVLEDLDLTRPEAIWRFLRTRYPCEEALYRPVASLRRWKRALRAIRAGSSREAMEAARTAFRYERSPLRTLWHLLRRVTRLWGRDQRAEGAKRPSPRFRRKEPS